MVPGTLELHDGHKDFQRGDIMTGTRLVAPEVAAARLPAVVALSGLLRSLERGRTLLTACKNVVAIAVAP
jgi:hypothetical protein